MAEAGFRLSRGATFATIASILAMVASNLDKIISFIHRLAARVTLTPKNAHLARSYWPEPTEEGAEEQTLESPPPPEPQPADRQQRNELNNRGPARTEYPGSTPGVFVVPGF
ncbi:hypothetical protein ET445_03760 [Agromyces protaetiae]|uniref:Uncharacterized protein n=1 Tax=Agromyces protaetiae TaxID=2509455 RepID=A0A4P6F9K9_9MICO|nr:hypothetical protein [Agromyces protaetiae]QAY72592.1 hypothetical protein ET445_03760 [Agromyces protaetiae]